MGVIIEDIRIGNEFQSEETNYLLGNVGDKITIEIDFRAEETFVTSDEIGIDRILLNVSPHIAQLPTTEGIIHCEASGAFANFRVDDLVSFYNSGSMSSFGYYIIEKISDETCRFSVTKGGAPIDFTGNPVDTSLPVDSYFGIITDLTSIKYRYNFVGNLDADSYQSKIDNNVVQFSASNVDNTDTVTQVPMTFNIPPTNNIGSAYVKGNGAGAVSQKFTIVHETFITPFILAGGLQDLKDRIKPSYFDSNNALKHILSIDVGRNANDPNYIQTVGFTALDGNTGWFDENFNGNPNNYYVDSVVYKRADTSVIDSVELTEADQTVEITVKNTVDAPFVDTATEYTANFCIAPNNEADYINNDKNVIQNFYFDRAFNTVGTAAAAGDNTGTDQKIIHSHSATYVSPTEIKITINFRLATAAVADLIARTDVEYFIWIGIQDHTLQTEESDRVSLLADIQPFFVDLTDDGMVTVDNKFLYHYESDVDTEGADIIRIRPEDDVLAYSQFYIDRNGRESDDISISSVTCELVAKLSGTTEFTLESFTQSFSGTQVISDTQYINAEVVRNFKMPDADQRRIIKVNRRSDLDTADLRYYEVYYPFLVRWEYWEVLTGVNGDMFDIAEPNNGQNQDWQRYDTIGSWDLYYRLTVNGTKNGESLRYQQETNLPSFDYLEDTDWINETIEAFDADTLSSLGTILKSPTKIVATKEYAGASPLTNDDVEWVIRIEVFEQGGISDIRYLSSVYDWTQFSWFNSVDASNKVVKNKVGNDFTAEALIDFGNLPQDAKFSISARIYDKTAGDVVPSDAKLMEDGTPKLTEAGDYKILD